MQTPIRSVQALRAVAALLVLIFHFDVQLHRLGYTGQWAIWPQRGVDIFFIISGLVMYLSTSGRKVGVGEFYLRRILRIAPLYYLLTIFLVAILLAAPVLSANSALSWWHVALSLVFIPSLHPTFQMPYPVLIPGWTLNCEMLFYLVFGGTLLLPETRRVATTSFLLALIVLAASFAPKHSAVFELYGWSILLEFSLGLALGAAVHAGRYLPASQAWWWLLGGVVALTNPFAESARVLVGGLPALAIVASVVSLEKANRLTVPKVAVALGNASYSLYLSQQVTLAAVTQVFLKLGLVASPWALMLYMPTAIICAIAAAFIIYYSLELPLSRVLLFSKFWIRRDNIGRNLQKMSEENDFGVRSNVV
ncbi:acyltransferase [Methylobacterium sp. SD21]|uniref:acyltransferase family protein n=1 Tax=Methylobacterium litchii TaxID=3138810 RepID=UPI00313A9397